MFYVFHIDFARLPFAFCVLHFAFGLPKHCAQRLPHGEAALNASVTSQTIVFKR